MLNGKDCTLSTNNRGSICNLANRSQTSSATGCCETWTSTERTRLWAGKLSHLEISILNPMSVPEIFKTYPCQISGFGYFEPVF